MYKKDFSYFVTKFFSDFLPNHKGYSHNTISSYKDSFLLFFKFCDEYKNINIDTLSFENLNTTLILESLSWLENERKVSVSTRNQRLASFKSFCKFVQLEAPEFYDMCASIRKIEMKKTTHKPLNYLSVEATKILMQQPNIQDKQELRDLALLALLYDSAARVSEITNMKVANVLLNGQNIVQLFGKGNKTRFVPITKEVAGILRNYITTFNLQNDDLLFFNKSYYKLTRKGVTYILNKYVLRARTSHQDLFNKKITPHCLRHSKAMHMVENNVNLIHIRDFLGHVSVATTEYYAKANPEIRRKQIENASENIIKESKYSVEEKSNLTEFLKQL